MALNRRHFLATLGAIPAVFFLPKWAGRAEPSVRRLFLDAGDESGAAFWSGFTEPSGCVLVRVHRAVGQVGSRHDPIEGARVHSATVGLGRSAHTSPSHTTIRGRLGRCDTASQSVALRHAKDGPIRKSIRRQRKPPPVHQSGCEYVDGSRYPGGVVISDYSVFPLSPTPTRVPGGKTEPFTASDILLKAASLVEQEGVWCQGRMWDGEARCAVGAILDVAIDLGAFVSDALDRLAAVIGPQGSIVDGSAAAVTHWNDTRGRTAFEVADAMRRAAS